MGALGGAAVFPVFLDSLLNRARWACGRLKRQIDGMGSEGRGHDRADV
jgi:hypothetical protein